MRAWCKSPDARLLGQVASGVRHMHAQGFGHGDLKPENVLLFDEGKEGVVAKVADFGMARGEARRATED